MSLIGASSLDLRLNDSQSFTPFLLDAGNSVQISDATPSQNFLNVDLTALLFQGIPFAGAGVSLDGDIGLQESLTGDQIYVSNPGSSIYSDTDTLPFTGNTTILSYTESAQADVIIGLWPGLYAEAFGHRFDFNPVRIPVTAYSI